MDRATYFARRAALRSAVDGGVILLLGNAEAPRNYLANPYPFRQSSHLLYFAGAKLPDLALALLPDGEEILLGPPPDPDDLIWHGPHPVLADHAAAAGIARHEDIGKLAGLVGAWRGRGLTVHYLNPYRADRAILLSETLGIPPRAVASGASTELARAVVALREIKSSAEVAEIEEALGISAKMYQAAFELTRPGVREAEIAAAMQAVYLDQGRAESFLPIVSVRGEVLHNTSYCNTLREGELLLVDSGTESPHCYASDITRTIPVSGRFSGMQRAIYETVLAAEQTAIAAVRPGRTNKEVHFQAARTIAAGLKEAGLMRGDVDEAVAAGAHALFFVHGIGHMLGLDVHDMEDLGDAVGYPAGEPRSTQFGLSFLRLAKELRPGFVITIEPGVYFVPALIDRWRAERRHEAFIAYAEVDKLRGFGGIRIEDDVLVTDTGHRVLGPKIPKEVVEVERAMAR